MAINGGCESDVESGRKRVGQVPVIGYRAGRSKSNRKHVGRNVGRNEQAQLLGGYNQADRESTHCQKR
ncbi:hypothetical protein FA15DRAFT_672145 [Coprinopsis marcescibilis]|uniref:Uncharacterized protein n=1 Tax=Coprinopsis marcescibilis TaxID=230819 RepID=A0A5C3KN13_COPMA|nr:hypothetical protein FA15DRAFT_672145 [Coprinopsis marcescibilis]